MPTFTNKESPLLPDGIYPFEVVNATEKVSNAGNAKIELTLLVGPDHTRVYDNITFTEASAWRITAFLQATGTFLKANEEVSVEAEDCIGRKGECSIITETYNGRTRNRIDAYLLPNPVASTASPSATKSKFSEPNPKPGIDENGDPDNIPF